MPSNGEVTPVASVMSPPPKAETAEIGDLLVSKNSIFFHSSITLRNLVLLFYLFPSLHSVGIK